MAASVWPALLLAFLPLSLPAADGYLGSEACGACHQPQLEAWKQSHHHQAMLPATEEHVLGDFDDATFEYAGLTHRFFRKDGRYLVETDNAEGELQTFEVAYTFGFDPLQQYLIGFPDGRYQALNIVWDSRPGADGGQRWYHLYPDDAVTHDDPLHWTGSFQNWNSRCASCHSTGLEKNYDLGGNAYDTTWAEINVACEACHGPGQAHARWAAGERDAPDPGFANALPAPGVWVPREGHPTLRLDGDASMRTRTGACAGCHSRRAEIAPLRPGAAFADLYQLSLLEGPLYHPDGQVSEEVYVHGSFLQSRMHAAGVSCSDCHDPHSGRPRAEGNALCARCHQPDVFDRPAHHHHAEGSEGAACVNCHMPATTYMGVDPRRDHSLRVPEPRLSVEWGIPNACNTCHDDRDFEWAAGAVAAWFPDSGLRAAHAGPLAAARENRADALPRLLEVAASPSASGIVRATALLESGRFPSGAAMSAAQAGLQSADPLIRAAAVRALEAYPAGQRYLLLSPLISDPALSVRTDVAAQLADVPLTELTEAQRAELRRLRNEYLDTLRLTADMPEGLLNLGNFLARSGAAEAAERAYRQALLLSPGFVPASINLADLYRANGLDPAAEKLLQDALTRMPDHAAALHSLGLLRVRQGRVEDAVTLLARAAELEPANARYSYVYAVALYELGRQAEAIRVLEEALDRHPGHPDIEQALQAYRASGPARPR